MPSLRVVPVLGAAALLSLLILLGPAAAQPSGATMIRFDPIPGFDAQADVSGYFDLMPGATRALNVTLRNTGNATLALSIRAEEPAPPDAPRSLAVALSSANVTLEPGATLTLVAQVSAVPGAVEGTNTTLMLLFSRGEQSAMEPVPVHIGPPCQGCQPPSSNGQLFVTGPGGGPGGPGGPRGPGGSTGDQVVRAPSGAAPRANGTEAERLAEDDPYNEVPGPGILVALGGLGGALALRSRRAGALALVAVAAAGLALAAPLVGAQGSTTTVERTYALVNATREGDDVVATLHVVRGQPYRITVSLYSRDGLLLAPEQVTSLSWFDTRTSYRFSGVNATQMELRVQFTREDGNRSEERFPISVAAAAQPRLEVLSAAWDVDTDTGGELPLRIEVANLGPGVAEALTAHLEDERGTRIGDPLTLQLGTLGAGNATMLSFRVREALDSATLVLEHETGAERLLVELPALGNGTRLELVQVDAWEDGGARFLLANLGEAPLADVLAHVQTDAGARVGVPAAVALGTIARGAVAEVRVRLPEDMTSVRLVVSHAQGATTFPVRLDESAGNGSASLEMDTDLPARDATPGDTATYTVKLTNDGDESLVTLRADGLPEGYSAAFTIAGSSVRSVSVPASGARDVTVAVIVPASATRDVGRTLAFDVVATADDGSVASVDLALTLLGEGKLELTGQNWFATATPGSSQEVALTVRNTGSAEVRDVEMEATKPTGWSVSFAPSTLDVLAPGASRTVVMTVQAAADAGAGRYTLDIAASNADLTTRPRSLVVEIASEGGSKLPWVAGAALAGLAAVALVVKLRRK